jgi:uncharacterized damage-inducible protein DinB
MGRHSVTESADDGRVEPETTPDERAALDQFLDYYRATLANKVAGLTTEQARRQACPPSTLNLLGLVRHMADVERWWFRNVLVGDPIAPRFYTEADPELDMQPPAEATLEEAVAALHEEITAARATAAAHSLDDLAANFRGGKTTGNLRWIMVHMIEEYARHCGHADLLREAIDGVTGD